jgi:hypothetical protein
MDKFVIMNVHDTTQKNPKIILKFSPFSFWSMKNKSMLKKWIKIKIKKFSMKNIDNLYFEKGLSIS